MVYGNPAAAKPNYDITYFENRIPDKIAPLNIGSEKGNSVKTTETVEPLFIDKRLLWLVMGMIIVLLGWLAIRMLTSEA